MKSTTFLLLLITTIGFAQNDKPQRKAFTLKLGVDKAHFYKTHVPQSNYFVKDKVLQIYSSEKLFIETTLQNDTIATMKVVKKIEHPERTIEIDFYQETEGRKVIGSMLNVKNPFDKNLLYDANMFITNHDKWVKTSIVPIPAHLQGFETWGDVIITLCLENWRFVE